MRPRPSFALLLAVVASAVALAGCGAGSPPSASGLHVPCPGPRTTFGPGNHPPACWRPYAATSPFNRVIPERPRLLAGSAAIVRELTSWGRPQALVAGHADTPRDYFHPLYWSHAGDPVYTVHCVRFSGCPVEGLRLRIPAAARAAGGADGHMAVIDARAGWEYDFWQVRSKPRTGGRMVVSFGGRTRIDGDGLGSNATAAWFGLAAGVIRAPEMEAGRIDHALFVHVRCTAGRSVYPAHPGTTAAPCSRLGVPASAAPPLGARLWLDLPLSRIAQLPVPRWRKTILAAMHRYGMIIGDTSGGNVSFGLQAESGSSYTSFGERDAWSLFAAFVAPELSSDGYVLKVDGGVDWARHLHVLAPCVSRGRCPR